MGTRHRASIHDVQIYDLAVDGSGVHLSGIWSDVVVAYLCVGILFDSRGGDKSFIARLYGRDL